LGLAEGEGYTSVMARKERREAKLGHDIVNKRWHKLLWFYMPRLIGTGRSRKTSCSCYGRIQQRRLTYFFVSSLGGNWFVWDVTFYGLKLYSGPIFEAINPGGDLVVQNGYLLVNNLIALVGYYCAAALIDRPYIGRKRLQMFSFVICAIIFTTTAAVFESASTPVLIFLVSAGSRILWMQRHPCTSGNKRVCLSPLLFCLVLCK
jgi:hypothetical protein